MFPCAVAGTVQTLQQHSGLLRNKYSTFALQLPLYVLTCTSTRLLRQPPAPPSPPPRPPLAPSPIPTSAPPPSALGHLTFRAASMILLNTLVRKRWA